MSDIPLKFRIPAQPVADPRGVVRVPQARFTILTPGLIRMEFSPDESFEDRASQVFWYRRQPVPDYHTVSSPTQLEIITQHFHLRYSPALPFTQESLEIYVRDTGMLWHPGTPDPANLRGPVRTLDNRSGPVPLPAGLISRSGWTLLDDSRTLVFNPSGWLEPRFASPGTQDLYFFAYGLDYQSVLSDYTKIAGTVPLIPRWALGNWWSRYWKYSAQELSQLMLDFQSHNVPLSVCIIDMDWHITQTGNRSSGWTGYTWNRSLFPDPAGFLSFLHKLGLKAALNLHPAEGVHPHEEAYYTLAMRMGVDPESLQPVEFNLADPQFASAYFEILHHPHEDIGVDFWWLDWQQGELTSLPGLDPLWWLNHLHALDRARDGSRRPFIFSRWGGLGNHRYPIGFSGDTHVTWEALTFQPYFTATSANVFYNWWSHDIGGHMFGMEEPELYVRWVQFGALSPILRLHSTKVPFHERLPWGYDAETERAASSAMRLRHALIPYLYTLAWREHVDSIPPIRPMYYAYPEREEAYHCPNQYLFGDDLITAPFTSQIDPDTRLARQVIWLPEGDWFDFFTGEHATGGGWAPIYGDLQRIPLFAHSGALVPLDAEPAFGAPPAPSHISLRIFPGANHRFDLYEDDGESNQFGSGVFSITPITQIWEKGSLSLEIDPPEGGYASSLPVRTWDLVFYALRKPDQVSIKLNNTPITATTHYDPSHSFFHVGGVMLGPDDRLEIKLTSFSDSLLASTPSITDRLYRLLKTFRLDTMVKYYLSNNLGEIVEHPDILAKYLLNLKPVHLRLLLETITGAGIEQISSTGEEQLILWNNSNDPRARYQLSIENSYNWDPRARFQGGSAPLPRFKHISISHKLSAHPWLLYVTYLDLLRLSFPESR